MKISFIGQLSIDLGFILSLVALFLYFWSTQKDDQRSLRWANLLTVLVFGFTLVAMSSLVYLLVTHQFQYFYVYNYTSTDLALRYLVAALWGGQEGSFLVWIFFTVLTALALIRWSPTVYKAPVMFFMMLSISFLLSMTLGWDVLGLHLGASPFRTLVEEMPNAPFLQANPDFVPVDGRGLNDLLRSPWMVIHPPILFMGFAMMTVPFAFALAALWKRHYHEWITPALPWTLAANLCLFVAIFLGAYWAYVTLSFGGFWAWDPVENASLVPWIFGVAGIHTMLIQRKHATASKASFLFAIFAYILILYEAFLTRSGILGDASVHSFVDLGLYNQLLLFMVGNALFGIILLILRYKDLPGSKESSSMLSPDFIVFSGAIVLFVTAMVIILGTSSPIIGKLFSENPTPPEISFYNNWTAPLAMVISLLTVFGQYVWRKRIDSFETLASRLLWPLIITAVLTITSIMLADVREPLYMAYLFCTLFALIGNGFMLVEIVRRNPKLSGGALTHVGFAVLLIGSLASTAYNHYLLDQESHAYNAAVEQGLVKDDNGFPVIQKVTMFKLDLNQPKKIDDGWTVTYEGMRISNVDRPGEQRYQLRFERDSSASRSFTVEPVVYPMVATSTADNISWSVDPEVRAGITSDLYLYVASSGYLDRLMQSRQPAMQNDPADTSNVQQPTLTLKRGEERVLGPYKIFFTEFESLTDAELPDSAVVGVRALLAITDTTKNEQVQIKPSYAIVAKGAERFSMSQPVMIDNWDLIVRFDEIDPNSDAITLSFRGEGLPEVTLDDWVLVVAENKPFISFVWFGTFLLMGGFSVSIVRRWAENKKKRQHDAPNEA